jgi:hypothetical protein
VLLSCATFRYPPSSRPLSPSRLTGCEHCGRKFASDRLAIHQRSCTADNPARRVGERQPGGGGGPVLQSGDGDEFERPRTSGGSGVTPARPSTSSAGARGSTAGLSATVGAPGTGARPGTSSKPPAASTSNAGLSQSTRLPALSPSFGGGSAGGGGGGALSESPQRTVTPVGGGGGGAGVRSPSPAALQSHAHTGWQHPSVGLTVGDGSFAEALLDLQVRVARVSRRRCWACRWEGLSAAGGLLDLLDLHLRALEGSTSP